MAMLLKRFFGKLPMARSARAYKFALDNLLDVPPQSTVLDIGTGQGFGSAYLSRHLPECHLLSLDITHECFKRDKLKFGHRLPHFLLADVGQIPLTSNCLDIVFMVMTFHCLPDPRGVIQEIVNTLKPGGSLILADVDGEHPIAPFFELVEHIGISPLTHAYTRSELRFLFEDAGLQFEVHKRPNRKNGLMMWIHGRKVQ